VIVAFHPDSKVLLSNVSVLKHLGLPTLVFDNTPNGCAIGLRSALGNVHYLTGNGNVGLASAYNAAADYCRAQQIADAILLLDQDSILESSSVRRLLDTYEALSGKLQIGVIGGRPVRRTGGTYRTLRAQTGRELPEHVIRCAMVISSFSLIPLKVFEVVGRFHDDFFIDHIEFDF